MPWLRSSAWHTKDTRVISIACGYSRGKPPELRSGQVVGALIENGSLCQVEKWRMDHVHRNRAPLDRVIALRTETESFLIGPLVLCGVGRHEKSVAPRHPYKAPLVQRPAAAPDRGFSARNPSAGATKSSAPFKGEGERKLNADKWAFI